MYSLQLQAVSRGIIRLVHAFSGVCSRERMAGTSSSSTITHFRRKLIRYDVLITGFPGPEAEVSDAYRPIVTGNYNGKRDAAENSKFENRKSQQIRVLNSNCLVFELRISRLFRVSNFGFRTSLLHRWRIPVRKTTLMPIGIRKLCCTGGVELGDLVGGEFPTDSA